MKVGDLVRDIEDGDLGIVIAVCDLNDLYTVMRFSGLTDDMWGEELEVINENR